MRAVPHPPRAAALLGRPSGRPFFVCTAPPPDAGISGGSLISYPLPALAGLFWLAWRIKRDGEAALASLARRLDRELERLRAALAQHRLDVATGYASLAALESVEERLTAHLLRIEAKLDGRGQP